MHTRPYEDRCEHEPLYFSDDRFSSPQRPDAAAGADEPKLCLRVGTVKRFSYYPPLGVLLLRPGRGCTRMKEQKQCYVYPARRRALKRR